jgi:hypothetical protein
MNKLRIAKIALLVMAALLVVAFLHYNLPRAAVVTIEGTDVKRTDNANRMTNPASSNESGVRDLRFVNTITRNNRVLVLRNEDTGWGWPPYFKFNSSDLVAKAQAFANQKPSPPVLITFYGWRIQLFSMYPNIIRMRAVAPDYSHFPWFNIIFLALLSGGFLYVRIKVKRLYQSLRDRFSPAKASPADAADNPNKDG